MKKKNSIPKELRDEIIAILQRGEMPPQAYMHDLFPAAKAECELTYGGKTRVEDILAQTMAMPLQRARLFGKNGDDWHNMLVFGDNLQVMKSLLQMKKEGKLCNADGTPGIRLVYIDPPFASKQELRGDDGERAYRDKLAEAEFLEFVRKRLVLIRELLADDGSVYVHLDNRMNAYVRVLMDEIFGKPRFNNQIIWSYRRWPGKARKYQSMHDSLLFYTKENNYVWNAPMEPKSAGTPSYKRWNTVNEDGTLTTHYDKSVAVTDTNMRDVWELTWLQSNAKERVGYPTQKPEALLERLVRASSNPGDIVADFFAGSGTACAVAEKLSRRWIGVDCGKLSVYTTQKRMLHLRENIGNAGKILNPKPFALYNAGLYDLNLLRDKQWDEWRKFALLLFECRDEPHIIGGIEMDGYRKGKSVQVFNHHKFHGGIITEETIDDIHARIGRKVGDRVFIIAPMMSFGFSQDYIDRGKTRYYALRIPYSIINELHRRGFTALQQPVDENTVNESVESVGFDFIHRPQLKYSVGAKKRKGEKTESAFIKVTTFKSEGHVAEQIAERGNLETLSMLMLDCDYDEAGQIFEVGKVLFADALQNDNWTAFIPKSEIGGSVMAIFVDIYGNEARELIPAAKFGIRKNKAAKKAVRKTRSKK